MIEAIVILAVLALLFGIGYIVTGVILKALIWLGVLLPISILLFGLGIICCCTIILIPVGLKLFEAALHILFCA